MHAPILGRLTICSALACMALTSGCMNPSMYYGNPYNRPMYSPPQMINQAAPGQLVIPESNDGLYEPGSSTYDSDPDDDFRRSEDDDDDARFFQPDDGAPLPRDLNNERFKNDFGGPTTLLDPQGRANMGDGNIQLASYNDLPIECGFDTADYRWLRGILHYVPSRDAWVVEYSWAANDKYRGNFVLDVTNRQISGFKDGDAVDVHGTVGRNTDQAGTFLYRVEMIRPMATRVAMQAHTLSNEPLRRKPTG